MQIPFAHRPPSVQWEPLPIVRFPGLTLWTWYRPQRLPLGLIVSIPPDVQAAFPAGFPFTLLDLFLAAGVEPSMVHSAAIYSTEWQTAAVFGPWLNHTMPPAGAGANPEIAVQVHQHVVPAETIPVPHTMAPAGTYPNPPLIQQVAPDAAEPVANRMMYERIDNSWRSSIQMERQMTGLRQKLASVMAALGKFDRDLNPDERLAADREDRDAWQEPRRWMRDLSARCHREVKTFDIGMTSAAGKRNAIEQLHAKVIEPQAPGHDLMGIRREFETYRKEMANLQKSMQTTLQAANQNGTQRAHRVLSTISRKIRERRARMREPIGGMNLDKSVRSKS
ncbi:MAG: hypothetical protein ABGZ35_19340 [Planctomycetaceae bacterium]